ncbi:MAG: glycosyl hydrolase [Lachnospiraceae bacterium]|nr:glycosyl hydrolase [Lachnospiraceae bacterium]MDD3614646.1 glycosyl hydrolase [Lachnospiraceae bacterium]
MLYKNREVTKEKFQNPTAEYRGAPFWAWNTKMTKEAVDHTLEELQAMGMGGGHLHCRTGMNNEYLGEEFMELIHYTNEQAKKRDMLTWLYDEDRWPSGAGGGYVTKEEQYRIRFLVFSPAPLRDDAEICNALSSTGQAVRSNNRTFLGSYKVQLEDGSLSGYEYHKELIANDGQTCWYAYLEVSGDNPWFNNQAYLNTLDKKSVERFIEVTHEKYAQMVGDEFGKSIPSIFTDEPQFSHKSRFAFAGDRKEITIPFTDDLEGTFTKQYGHSILEHLPELFWELPENEVSLIRYEYHDHIAERFSSAFADTIGSWCREHGIMLTGHMMEEPTLESQTAALGEAMRSYRAFELPGVDMLCDRRELSTVKQAQSASHQFGREGVISELYGVTNWDFDFRGHKLQGDWQAALGVTVRVPHLTWTSMAGEAKRDYPASIGYQSPWYQQYSYVEDYFARINTVLTAGKPEVKIGVIHPIESYWLYWGTEEQTGGIRKEMDSNFADLIDWMLYGCCDFDFIAESLLPQLAGEQSQDKEGKLQVGAMAYDVILVPNCLTLRSSTLEVLEAYEARGGKIIFTGSIAQYEGAVLSDRGQKLARRCRCITFNQQEILKALAPYQGVEIRDASGNRCDHLLTQIRSEGSQKWLFAAQGRVMENPDIPVGQQMEVRIPGIWEINTWNPLDGTVKKAVASYEDNKTIYRVYMYEHDSLLLQLIPASKESCDKEVSSNKEMQEQKHAKISQSSIPLVSYTLSEPNVFILDMPEYRFDEEAWQSKDEILRIDNLFREKLGYPLRMEAFAQPWVNDKPEEYEHTLSLRWKIPSRLSLPQVSLALEDAGDVAIIWNGEEVKSKIDGYYVDRWIDTLVLGQLKDGENELIVQIPYNSKRNVECMYLLGSFGVQVQGSLAEIKKAPEKISFSDITTQGFPFYGGNVNYELEVEGNGKEVCLEITKFRNPVLAVSVDGCACGYIAYSPYKISLGTLSEGKHKVVITGYGNRVNTFGTIHNCDEQTEWYGPNGWRTVDAAWAYEYQLKKTGILKSPVIYTEI